MKIIYTKSYDKTYKDLKRHKKELETLDKILTFIKKQDDFNSMINDPLALIYHFERLKHELNEFYSFRISKIIRLIVRPVENGIEIELVYISTNHYKDFDKGKVIYYDE